MSHIARILGLGGLTSANKNQGIFSKIEFWKRPTGCLRKGQKYSRLPNWPNLTLERKCVYAQKSLDKMSLDRQVYLASL